MGLWNKINQVFKQMNAGKIGKLGEKIQLMITVWVSKLDLMIKDPEIVKLTEGKLIGVDKSGQIASFQHGSSISNIPTSTLNEGAAKKVSCPLSYLGAPRVVLELPRSYERCQQT